MSILISYIFTCYSGVAEENLLPRVTGWSRHLCLRLGLDKHRASAPEVSCRIRESHDARQLPIVQTRRAEALRGFRLASSLHEKERRHPATRGVEGIYFSQDGERISFAIPKQPHAYQAANANLPEPESPICVVRGLFRGVSREPKRPHG